MLQLAFFAQCKVDIKELWNVTKRCFNLQQLAKVIVYYSSRLGLDYSHLAIMVSALNLALKRPIQLTKVNLDIN